jgi:hypothetical protein
LTIEEDVLSDWARLFDEPGTPAAEARLLRPITEADLRALSVLADQPTRLVDHNYHWTRGHEEDRARARGVIRWETTTPTAWDEVILQGPHFTIATPFAKQPNEHCRHNQDYSEWDLEALPESVIPRTNYQLGYSKAEYTAELDQWDGKPYTEYWRLAWRRMTQPGLERSVHTALIPPGPAHVFTVHSLAIDGSPLATTLVSAITSSLVIDYLVKVSGRADITIDLANRIPVPKSPIYESALVLRALRLNCLTSEFAPLWEALFDHTWLKDRWTDPTLTRVDLGSVAAGWSMATPLRRDLERRLALIELDALTATMFGLSAEQLCAIYRTQFAVLRKYEYGMVFDAEGRKICEHHQSAGYRQSELHDRAKRGELPKEWQSIWHMYEGYETDPSSVDWRGYYMPPFYRPDREKEMTRACEEFQRRLEAGEYG